MRSEGDGRLHGWMLDDSVMPNARVRQGDLVRFESATDPLRKLAIVVTADCDLEQKKHARTITLVPVISATEVIERYLILGDCEKKKEHIENFAFKESLISPDHDVFTKYALLREKSANATDSSSTLNVAVSFLLHETDNVSFSQYNALMAAMKMPARKIDSFKSQLRTRGDLLGLPEAHELGIKGHVSWVRQLWQIATADVALRTSEVAERPGERIARLDSPFRYRLTQLIAQVFSDIGLPDLPDSIDQMLDEAYR